MAMVRSSTMMEINKLESLPLTSHLATWVQVLACVYPHANVYFILWRGQNARTLHILLFEAKCSAEMTDRSEPGQKRERPGYSEGWTLHAMLMAREGKRSLSLQGTGAEPGQLCPSWGHLATPRDSLVSTTGRG